MTSLKGAKQPQREDSDDEEVGVLEMQHDDDDMKTTERKTVSPALIHQSVLIHHRTERGRKKGKGREKRVG